MPVRVASLRTIVMDKQIDHSERGVRLGPGVVIPADRLRFSYSASRGPGGQNVNKRQTKAEMRVWPGEVPLRADAMARLLVLAEPWLTSEGELLIVCDEHRSQGRNRDGCIERLALLVRQALVKPKPRRKTRPSRSSVERRLEAKKAVGERKRRRGAVDGE